MILAIPEYDDYPASPSQWDRFYHTLDDVIYIQAVETTDPAYPEWVEMSRGAAVRESMRHEISLVRSQYSAKDYQTFLDDMVAQIAERWGDRFNDFMTSEPAMMIAEYVAAAFDQMSWYLDRETDEHYIELARIRSNVVRLARYLGYKPGPAVSGSVDLEVTLSGGPYGFDVPLQKYHQFEGPNGLVFELGSEQVISAGATGKIVGVYQGEHFTESFISTGEENQRFDLSLVPDGGFLSLGKIVVTVGLEEWLEVDFLPYGADDAYEVAYLTTPPSLRFGDGVIGKIPPAGAEIKVDYVATAGKQSALAVSGTITKSLTPVVVNFQQIPLSVTNANPVSGGADAESVDEVRTRAPQYFLSAERLVTQGDYESLAGSYRGASGAVAKANAIIVRGVAQDLELKGLMDALTADRSALDGYLDGIKTDQDGIVGYTGESSVPDTIRYFCALLASRSGLIKAKVDEMDALVGVVAGNLDDSQSDVDLARTQLSFLPFQEMVGMGNGAQTSFTTTLARRPVVPGSATVIVEDLIAVKSGTDGDCDATPGRLVCVSIPFAAGDRGRTIRIGGEYRQITKILGADVVEYSGPRIYGTSLLVDIFPAAIVGYDDGAGSISGAGISSGTIDYVNGVVTLNLTTAPDGIVGQYGVPLIVSYQYTAEGILSFLDAADVDIDAARVNVAIFGDYGVDLDGYADDVVIDKDGIVGVCDDIDVVAEASIVKAESAGAIPDQIQIDIDAVYEYLDTVISGNCKANIVRVSILALDANGFYVAPSLALLSDVKTYLDARKIQTIQNSVVSGGYYLVKVKLIVEIAVEKQYVFQQVQQGVASAVDEMFKGRSYAQGLLRSEYYGVVDGVDGVSYSNNSIGEVAYVDPNNTGTPPSPDSDGNLLVGDYEVITKWDVVISQIG